MKRIRIARWVQVCVLGSAFAGGCNRQEVPVAQHGSDLLPPVSTWSQKDTRVVASSTKQPDGKIVQTAYGPPQTGQAPVVQIKDAPGSRTLPPVVFPETSVAADLPAPTAVAPKPPVVATAPPAKTWMTEREMTAKAVVMKSASRYGHGSDYAWIAGEVQQTRKGWRVRYASLDETDPFGGSMTLADDAQLSKLHHGDFVRIEGRLQNANDRGIAPVYVIGTLEMQEK